MRLTLIALTCILCIDSSTAAEKAGPVTYGGCKATGGSEQECRKFMTPESRARLEQQEANRSVQPQQQRPSTTTATGVAPAKK